MLIRGLIFVVVIVLAAMAYVRLAPTNPALWHRLDVATAPDDLVAATGFTAVRGLAAPAPQVLGALEQVALATPRTRVIAGSVASGMVTFRTRSLVWGFPDFTTAAVQGDFLVIHGRLRFGGSDLGVNRARVLGWVDKLGPLIVAP